MIDLKKRAGRLVTLRFLPPVNEEEFDRFEAEVREFLQSTPSPVIFCTDLRGAAVFTDTLTPRIVGSMRRNSQKIKRSALLLPSEGAILTLQFERIIREAGNPARRTFRKPQEASVWLGEVLFAGERESLSEFIAEWLPGVGLMSPPSGRAPLSSSLQRALSQRAPLSGALLESTPSSRPRRSQR